MKVIGQEFVDFFDLQAAGEEQRRRTRAELAAVFGDALGSGAGTEALATGLWQLMSAPDRHYHTAVHVLAILGSAQRHGVAPEGADLLAVLFHDAVYDPRAEPGRNEAASAELVLERLPPVGVPREVCERAADSIRWTAHHSAPLAPAEHALVLDLDLIGLAAAPPAFRRQSTALEHEMRHLAPQDYFRGTIDLFTRLMQRPAIYHTAQLAPLEQAARVNVEAELARMKALLRDGPTGAR